MSRRRRNMQVACPGPCPPGPRLVANHKTRLKQLDMERLAVLLAYLTDHFRPTHLLGHPQDIHNRLLYHSSALSWAPSVTRYHPELCAQCPRLGHGSSHRCSGQARPHENMARNADHDRDCSNQFAPALCVLALHGVVLSVPLALCGAGEN